MYFLSDSIFCQVCNSVYLRLNFSTPLCACPEPGDPCSASTLASDNHSLRLSADTKSKQVTANQGPHLRRTDQWEASTEDISEVLTVTTRHLVTIAIKEFLSRADGGASGESGTAKC